MKWHGKELKGVTQWEVWHPEGAEQGLFGQRYGSRREALQRAREWNKEVTGHVVRPVMHNSDLGRSRLPNTKEKGRDQ